MPFLILKPILKPWKMNKLFFLAIVASLLAVSSCKEKERTLPIIGKKEIINGDTIWHTIPEFKFTNCDGKRISNDDLRNNIYLADFFLISCPSICPKVKKQMLRIYEEFENDARVKLVSHTIDPKRDTPERLRKYADQLGVNTRKWMFLRGEKEEILDIAESYFVAAYEDEEAPGGFDHSGKIILVDKDRHVRSFAEGTEPDDVTRLIRDIHVLLKSYE